MRGERFTEKAGFWTAVILASFANLPSITAANWASLQPEHSYTDALERWRRRLEGNPGLRARYRRWNNAQARAHRAGVFDMLRRLYRADVGRSGAPSLLGEDDHGFARALKASRALDGAGGVRLAVLDDVVVDLPRIRSFRELRDAHAVVVQRLTAITGGDRAAIGAIAEELRACRPSQPITVLRLEPDGVRSLRTGQLPGYWEHDEEGKAVRRWGYSMPPDPGATLRERLDLYFLRCAIDGAWPRFYRCQACKRFNVAKQRLETRRAARTRFCGSACRAKSHRGGQRAAIEAALREFTERRQRGERIDVLFAEVSKKHQIPQRSLERAAER